MKKVRPRGNRTAIRVMPSGGFGRLVGHLGLKTARCWRNISLTLTEKRPRDGKETFPGSLFVQESGDYRGEDRASPHVEHPSERQRGGNGRPGCLSKVTWNSRAESHDHPDFESCLQAGAGGRASPGIEMRDKNRHDEDQHNPKRREQRIARFLQE